MVYRSLDFGKPSTETLLRQHQQPLHDRADGGFISASVLITGGHGACSFVC